MAKGSRASTRKANNTRLKNQVFGPVEAARTERLSAKLLELASRPKMKEDVIPEAQADSAEEENVVPLVEDGEAKDMEIDPDPSKTVVSKPAATSRRTLEKRRSSRKASIVFPKFKNGKRVTKSKGKK